MQYDDNKPLNFEDPVVSKLNQGYYRPPNRIKTNDNSTDLYFITNDDELPFSIPLNSSSDDI